MTGVCIYCGFQYDDEADPRDTNALLLVKEDNGDGYLVCPVCITEDYLMDDSVGEEKL